MPGVDGLRAVAIAAVVTYHIGASWLPGGFLGVDVFLVISGYLITSLLLAERRLTTAASTWCASGSGARGGCCRRCS